MMYKKLCTLGTVALLVAVSPTTSVFAAKKSAVIKALEKEAKRSMEGYAKSDPPPYFIGYYVEDREHLTIGASDGAITADDYRRARLLDTDVRVGSYEFDNTHPARGGDMFANFAAMMAHPAQLPLEDDADAIRAVVWRQTDERYKAAAERLIKAQNNAEVKTEAEDPADDFSRESPETYNGGTANLVVDRAAWTPRVRELSKHFLDSDIVMHSAVELRANAVTRYIVNSEGTSIEEPGSIYRLILFVTTRADDGMDLYRYEQFSGHTIDQLPGDDVVTATMDRMLSDLAALREAPVMEPYTGPAILSGRAAGVFFHEIFGHRIEGHRQKKDDEGQTFTKKIGKQVLPDFISVVDDPTQEELDGTDLNGFYRYDDEGVKARPVPVVENGVLRNFLMARSPIQTFTQSNGHGRKAVGRDAVGRQGNLMVKSSKTVGDDELKKMLIEECKKQGKDFGLYLEDISGGFTLTGRYFPQAFQVTPIITYRIYTDGHEELVRGVDLIGTPLVSFSEIKACGKTTGIFNGVCGAESGWVLVSAVSPSIFTAQIEVQKKAKSADRPPLLPAPTKGGDS